MRFFLALCLWLFVAVQANAVVWMKLSNGASVEGFPKNCAEVVSMLQSKYANAPTLTRCTSANESYTVYAKNPSSGSDYVWVTLYLSEVCDGSRFSADGTKPLGQKCVRLQCNEGDALGSYKVATAYWQISPHVLKQPIMADADAKNYKVCIQGCVAKTTDVSGCNDATTVAPNLELVKCTLAMQETSQKCQIWGDPTDTPAFTGSVGPGDGSGTGNEPTDPENPGGGTGGDGGTPGGGTGGTPGGGTGGDGGTPGGGTGGTPGGGTGGDGGTPGGGTGGTPGGGTGGTPGGGTGGGKEQLNCGAPGQPACRISEEGMKSVDGDEGDSELSLIDYHNKNALDQIGSVVKEKLMYGDWFPTINTAVCTNPTVPNPFGASSYEVDICKYVEIFAKFITGVICFFAVIGSVQQVTSAAKA